MSADEQSETTVTTEAAFGASHPLPTGILVTIVVLPLAGPPFIEGQGLIRRKDRAPHHYWVQFTGERGAKLRFIHPDWQVNPDRALALLDAFWRSRRDSAALIEDFFPNNGR